MKIELNRDQIKYIAVFTMLLNHVANIFLQPGTFACEALKDIGYFTAPVMCWFLVEGYRYTRSVKKYAGRLLIFAVISQLPYYLAFARNHLAPWYTLNMIFTLFLCLCLMIAEEKISDPGKKSLVVLGIIAVSSICDWAILAPLYTLWFYRAGEDPKRRKKAFFYCSTCSGDYGDSRTSGSCRNRSWSRGNDCSTWQREAVVLVFYNGKKITETFSCEKVFFLRVLPCTFGDFGIIKDLTFIIEESKMNRLEYLSHDSMKMKLIF